MTDAAPTRADGKLAVALISEVFWEPDGPIRLKERLAEAAERGADMAVLPEIPLNPWRPSTKEAHDDDAEADGRSALNRAVGGGAGGGHRAGGRHHPSGTRTAGEPAER